jgi:hypothetical protein
MIFVLAAVALILALIDEFRAHGQSLTGWAVVALALIHLIGRIP